MRSIGLLSRAGIKCGVTTNDPDGWAVGYMRDMRDMRDMRGGDLLTGFELGDTARAAVRPLLAESARNREARRGRER
jgi:hypothetical protein